MDGRCYQLGRDTTQEHCDKYKTCAGCLSAEIDQLTAERDRYKSALEGVALESSSSGGDLWIIHELATDALEHEEGK